MDRGKTSKFELQLSEKVRLLTISTKVKKKRSTLSVWFRNKSLLIQMIITVAIAAFFICSLCIAA